MLNLIWKFILGLLIGFTARILLPGTDPIGFWLTGIIGVVGSFGGHFLASAVGLESGEKPSGRFFSALISVAGAVLLLLALRFLRH
ncbi:MAG: GlsB/YeaQ/YmgE family stress response membrane protein [Holophagaceae bacterium]|nr:GlsB/YeaQ/YmgE family stress response membrane protein [Holophagaceae bacterium]